MKDGIVVSRSVHNVSVDDVFTEEEIKTWVKKYYCPEDIFPHVDLVAWAEDNGLVKE